MPFWLFGGHIHRLAQELVATDIRRESISSCHHVRYIYGLLEERPRQAAERAFTIITELSRTCRCVTPVSYSACASIRLYYQVSINSPKGAMRTASQRRRKSITDVPNHNELHSINRSIDSPLQSGSRQSPGTGDSLHIRPDQTLFQSHRASNKAVEKVPETTAKQRR